MEGREGKGEGKAQGEELDGDRGCRYEEETCLLLANVRADPTVGERRLSRFTENPSLASIPVFFLDPGLLWSVRSSTSATTQGRG